MGNGTYNGCLAGEEKLTGDLIHMFWCTHRGNEYGGSFPDVFLFHWDKEKESIS